MIAKRKNKKAELLQAAVDLVAKGGTEAATVRAIARAAGVTEGAVYRHYRSKDELCRHAYFRIIDEMIKDKQALAARRLPFKEMLRGWVRLSYESYDHHPAAFKFVLLTPNLPPDRAGSLTTGQSELFLRLIEQAIANREIRPIEPKLALSHFTGILLNIIRMIDKKRLEGPATKYIEEISETVWRILEPNG